MLLLYFLQLPLSQSHLLRALRWRHLFENCSQSTKNAFFFFKFPKAFFPTEYAVTAQICSELDYSFINTLINT